MADRYRKKPVEVEAARWPEDGDTSYASVCQRADIHRWVWAGGGKTWVVSPKTPDDGTGVHVVIETLEGNMRIGSGDYVIRGIKGEFYPCKADIFEASYDKVDVG